MKIKEVIVVEGKDDIAAVKKAVEAEVLATGGFGFPKGTVERIRFAYEKCGIIVLTDPDYAGEKIRKEVEQIAPHCKHAFITREEGFLDGNIGVENASKEAIVRALQHVHTKGEREMGYTMVDMLRWKLSQGEYAMERRILLGNCLKIGYGNAKQMLSRLNHYGIEKDSIERCLVQVEEMLFGRK